MTWGSTSYFVGTGSGTPDAQALILGSAFSDNEVDFQNGIDFNGKARTNVVNDNVSSSADFATFSGVLSGTGSSGLSKLGSGTLNLKRGNSYAGGTTVFAGRLLVNNPSGSGTGTSAVSVRSGATLGGAGALSGAVTVSGGGILAPGAATNATTTVGTLSCGSLTLASASVLQFEISGTGTDRVAVTTSGGLTVNGGQVYLFQTGTTNAYSTLGTNTLMTYSGTLGGSVSSLSMANPVAGKTYAFTANGSRVQVAITLTPVSTDRAWTGGGTDGKWSTSGNWSSGVPAAGARLLFGANSRVVNTNDLTAETEFSGLVFTNTSPGFTLKGNAIRLAGGVTNLGANEQTVALPVVMANGAGVFHASSGNLAIAAAVTENGVRTLTKSGASDLRLAGTNVFSGGLSVAAGRLVADGGAALPDALTVSLADEATAQLRLAADETVGGLSGGGTTGGSVDMNGRTLTVSGSASTSYGGAITGGGTLARSGSGTLTLTGSSPWNGSVLISGGTLAANGTLASLTGLTVTNATLAGTGRIGGAVDVRRAGVVSPAGQGTGRLTTSNLTWRGGGQYLWEVKDATGVAGTGYDALDVPGLLDVQASGANPFTVRIRSLTAGGSLGNCVNFTGTTSYDWPIATVTNWAAAFDAGSFTLDSSAFANPVPPGGAFSLVTTNSGKALVVRYAYRSPTNYWDTSASAGIQGGSGTWDTDAFWAASSSGNDRQTWVSGNAAVFSAGNGTVSVSGSPVVSNITIGAGTTYTLSGPGALTRSTGALVLRADAAATVSAGLSATGSTTYQTGQTVGLLVLGSGGHTLTLGGAVTLASGRHLDFEVPNGTTGNFVVSVTGVLTIPGAGNLYVNTGNKAAPTWGYLDYRTVTMNVSGGAALSIGGGLYVGNFYGHSATVNANGGTITAAEIKLGETGGTGDGTRTLNVSGGTVTVTGANGIYGNSASKTLNVSSGLLAMQGNPVASLATFSFTGGTLRDVSTVNNVVTQKATTASSVLEVSGANSQLAQNYLVDASSSAQTATVHVAAGRILTVAAGKRLTVTGTNSWLAGAGTVNGSVTNFTGTLSPGATTRGLGSHATLTVQNLYLAEGARYSWERDDATVQQDTVKVTGVLHLPNQASILLNGFTGREGLLFEYTGSVTGAPNLDNWTVDTRRRYAIILEPAQQRIMLYRRDGTILMLR